MHLTTRGHLAVTLLVCHALAGCDALGEIGTRGGEADPADEIETRLGLVDSERIAIEIHEQASGSLVVDLPIDGQDLELVLEPSSARKNGFQLFVQGEDGFVTQIQAAPSTTLRGTIDGLQGSIVTGSLLEDGLHARIAFDDTTVYWAEPTARVAGPGDDTGEYVLYQDQDVAETNEACALEHTEQDDSIEIGSLALETTATAEGIAIAEVAVDADYEFYQAWGSVENAVARMEAVIDAVNVQYERDAGISHVITSAVVRTTPDDPYTTTDPLGMLQDELRPHWLQNHGDIERDVVHLFTGKDIDGGVIGIAYLSAICGSFGFGLSESTFSSNFSYVTDLTAHELGHNWAAEHCSCSSPAYTMNPFLTGANQFNPDVTVPTVEGFRDAISCLSYGDACPDDPDKTDPGACGCGVPDTDGDLDGTPDCNDGCPGDGAKTEPGQCGCGVPDTHSDGDGVADCNDGCPDDGAKTEPGQCGCGVPDTDSDGDGTADCVDGCPDDPTATDPAECPEPFCGDGSCDAGEDCSTCESDCGVCPPTCGDGVCDATEDCSTCSADCGACEPFCGDGTCDAGESRCSCSADCGAPPATELTCTGGLDDDCDGLVDCDDPDCDADASCTTICEPDGASCAGDSDCCSYKCRGPRDRKTCQSSDQNGGGGSYDCSMEGDPCKGNGGCCSKTCDRATGTCLAPPAGSLSYTGDGSGGEEPGTTIQASGSGGGSSNGLVGGCSSSGGGAGSLALFGLALVLAFSRRRRVQS